MCPLPHDERFDCAIIGGGPAGSTTALRLARAGLSTLIVDRESFPRFRIGESFLPRLKRELRELDVLDRVLAEPHMAKPGVEIGYGDLRRPMLRINFKDSYGDVEPVAFNMARSNFDAALLGAAKDAGVEVRTETRVESFDRLEDDDVRITTSNGPVRARWLVDASGQATLLARKLNLRHMHSWLRNVAAFGHFSNVQRLEDGFAGAISVVMADEGWFWIIPLDATRTSVGFVTHEETARSMPTSAPERLAWAIEHTPLMKQRMRDASPLFPPNGAADFTYRCDPFAGKGFFLVGDAAAFLDPVWSTGVSLGIIGGREAARAIESIVRRGADASAARERYRRWVERNTNTAFRMIHAFYDRRFRDFLLSERRPFGLDRAVVTLLAGEFDPIPFSARWRWATLERLARTNFGAPRIRPFSLATASARQLARPVGTMA